MKNSRPLQPPAASAVFRSQPFFVLSKAITDNLCYVSSVLSVNPSTVVVDRDTSVAVIRYKTGRNVIAKLKTELLKAED